MDFNSFCRVMKKLRQKIELVLDSIPNLNFDEIKNLEEIPADKRNDIEDQLWAIFVYGEYFIRYCVNKTRSALLIQPKAPPAVREYMDYHRMNYKSFIDKTKKLIDVSNAPSRLDVEERIAFLKNPNEFIFPGDINAYMGEYEYMAEQGWLKDHIKQVIESREEGLRTGIKYLDPLENRNIKNSFRESICIAATLYDYVTKPKGRLIESIKNSSFYPDEDDYSMEDEDEEDLWRNQVLDDLSVHLSNCDEAINKPYFRPDEWIANEKDSSAYFCVAETLTPPVLDRVQEIRTAFIYGHWMSVVALSRCLLEYALIEKARALETHPEIEGVTLDDLCRRIETSFPQLKKSMKFIRTEGNKVMHPPKEEEITNYPANKDIARKCINHITKIINTLYSEP